MSHWKCPFDDSCCLTFSDKPTLDAHLQSEHIEIQEDVPKFHIAISSASEEMDDSSVESLAERVPSREVPNVSTVIELLSMPEDPLSVIGQLSAELILKITAKSSLQDVRTLIIKDAGFSHFKSNRRLEIKDMVRLEELNLSDNYLQDLSGIGELTTLKRLTLDRNQIHSVTPLQSLVNLRQLSLARNMIKSVHSLPTFVQLREVDLSHNHLVNEIETMEFLQRQPRLENASLEGNPFMKRDRHMRYKLIGKLPQLSILDGEEITQIDYSISVSISTSGRTFVDIHRRRGSESESMTSSKAAQTADRLKDEVLHDPLFKRLLARLKQHSGAQYDETLQVIIEKVVRRVTLE